MTNTEMFLMQMASLRDQLLGAARTIEVMLELASRPSDAPTETAEKEECQHPMAARESRATMGHAGRFYCRRCGRTVEEKNGEGKQEENAG